MHGMLKNERVRDALKLFGIYLLIHGGMLILTGTFHDDWVNWFRDAATKDMEGWASGRPYYSAVIEAVWWLPGYGYRILAFFTYFAAYDFFYLTLCHVPEIRRQDAFTIAAISMAIPINDARVLLANYPYALGMMLFFIGTWMLVKHMDRLNRIGIRIGILAIFFASFTLNSNLVMYGGVLLYMMIRIRPKDYIKYADFVILPILFYGIGKILFPVYGLEYAEYNQVTIGGLGWTAAAIPATCRNLLTDMLTMTTGDNTAFMAALAGAVLCGVILFLTRKRQAEEPENGKRDLVLFLFGLVLFIAGFFPYVVVRLKAYVNLTGITSRDSMLLGFGAAMMIYSFPMRKLRRPAAVFIIILGMFHFGGWYLNYQAEWYRQLAFQHDVAGIEDIAGGGNYVVLVSQDSEIVDRRFYTWSGNAAAATGKKTAFLFNGEGNADMLQDPEKMEYMRTHYPMVSDYQYHPEIDGRLYFNVNVNREETIRLKMQEMFDKQGFAERIAEIGDVDYVKAETAETAGE